MDTCNEPEQDDENISLEEALEWIAPEAEPIIHHEGRLTMKVKITRRTIVGYAVNTSPSQGERGFYFERPDYPMWSGTLNTIGKKLREDRFLNSLTNTYYSEASFIKVKGKWRRVADERQFNEETWKLFCETSPRRYLEDEVEVEVEDETNEPEP